MGDARSADTLNAFVPGPEVRVAGRAGGPLKQSKQRIHAEAE